MASSASGSLALTQGTFSLSTAHSIAQRSSARQARSNAYVPPPSQDEVTLAFHPPPTATRPDGAAHGTGAVPHIETGLPHASLRERFSSQGGGTPRSPAHAALAAMSADGGTPKASEGSAQTLTSVQSVNGGIVELLATAFTPGVHFRGECAPPFSICVSQRCMDI